MRNSVTRTLNKQLDNIAKTQHTGNTGTVVNAAMDSHSRASGNSLCTVCLVILQYQFQKFVV